MTTVVKHGETKCMFVLIGQDLLNDPETLTYEPAREAVHCLGSCENTTRLGPIERLQIGELGTSEKLTGKLCSSGLGKRARYCRTA